MSNCCNMWQQGPNMWQQGPNMWQQGPNMWQQGPNMWQQGSRDATSCGSSTYAQGAYRGSVSTPSRIAASNRAEMAQFLRDAFARTGSPA
jgi:hypothetical protein